MYKELTSSFLAGYSYDEQTGALTVQFKNGKNYNYTGVPAAIIAGWTVEGVSHGAYFSANIKGHYPLAMIEPTGD